MFVYREAFYLAVSKQEHEMSEEVERKAEVIIAKQRNGPTGIVNLVFLKEFARFENKSFIRDDLPSGVDPVPNNTPDMPF